MYDRPNPDGAANRLLELGSDCPAIDLFLVASSSPLSPVSGFPVSG